MSLNLETILGAADLAPVEVRVPEWGGSVWMRGLTAEEADRYYAREAALKAAAKGDDAAWQVGFRARLVAAHLCDEAGALLMTVEQADALGRKSASVINRLAEAAGGLSALAASDVEAIEGNSGGTLGGGSSTATPSR